MSRAYIANVIYTKVGEPFKDWVNAQVDARNEKVAIEGDNVISMDPRIAEIFLNSSAISGTPDMKIFNYIYLFNLSPAELTILIALPYLDNARFEEKFALVNPDNALRICWGRQGLARVRWVNVTYLN